MKVIYAAILFLILACRLGQNKTDLTRQDPFEFILIDSLGTISIAFPHRADTFFSWIQRSDCGRPCEQGDYRFQNNRNPIFKESGFYWIGEPTDSVDQLSIYHSRPDTLLQFNDSTIIQMRNGLRKNALSYLETMKVLSDTLIRINDRNFCAYQLASFNKRTEISERRLIAFTTIRGTLLEFHYKLLTKRYDTLVNRFFDESLQNLKTVRIKDGG